MELEESDQFLSEYFELFNIIEFIIENGKIYFNELEQEKYKDLYPKDISTLRKKLNKMVERKYLRIESARDHEINNAHIFYCSTGNLEELIILLYNRLSAFINKSFKIKEIENLDVKLLEDLISRAQLFETQKSAKAIGANYS